jgi:hypothetical protein
MDFERLPEVLYQILGYVGTHRGSGPFSSPVVCKAWCTAFRNSGFETEEMLEACLEEEFSLEWLAARHGMESEEFERQLQRVMDSRRVEQTDLHRFWYSVSLHLQFWHRSVPGGFAVLRAVEICMSQSKATKGLDSVFFAEVLGRMLVFEAREVLGQTILVSPGLNANIPRTAFRESNFVCVRDLGCLHVGKTIREVLGTLVLVAAECRARPSQVGWSLPGSYCRVYCSLCE